jgi:hypothetical protein
MLHADWLQLHLTPFGVMEKMNSMLIFFVESSNAPRIMPTNAELLLNRIFHKTPMSAIVDDCVGLSTHAGGDSVVDGLNGNQRHRDADNVNVAVWHCDTVVKLDVCNVPVQTAAIPSTSFRRQQHVGYNHS